MQYNKGYVVITRAVITDTRFRLQADSLLLPAQLKSGLKFSYCKSSINFFDITCHINIRRPAATLGDYMENKFSLNLSKFRKARKLSQKQAAGDLGISQALLSHYEKGIRECGLSFLCRAADYYGVTVDCLLGREPAAAPLPPPEKSAALSGCERYAKIGGDSLNIVFALLEKINSDSLTAEASAYIFTAIHEICGLLSKAGSRDKAQLQLQDLYLRLSIHEHRCIDLLTGNIPDGIPKIDRSALPRLTREMLMAEFDSAGLSFLELIDIVKKPLNCIWPAQSADNIQI